MIRYLFIITTFFIAGCSSNQANQEPTYIPVNLPKESAPKESGYYCPMKCEGEKVYQSKRQPCPVCKMKLIHTK